jgi:hypothetical protein
MDRQSEKIRLALLTLGIAATACHLFNILAIPRNQEEVFLNQSTIAPVECVILFGILLVILFNLSSIVWVAIQLFDRNGPAGINVIALVLGCVCTVLLIGEKVMIDEIAREYRMGWETLGEWIILHSFLVIQLFYNILMLLRLSLRDTARQVGVQADQQFVH